MIVSRGGSENVSSRNARSKARMRTLTPVALPSKFLGGKSCRTARCPFQTIYGLRIDSIYYGETAHNPQTNQRLSQRVSRGSPRRSSPAPLSSTGSPARSSRTDNNSSLVYLDSLQVCEVEKCLENQTTVVAARVCRAVVTHCRQIWPVAACLWTVGRPGATPKTPFTLQMTLSSCPAGDVQKRSVRPRSNSVEGVWNDKKPTRSCSSDPPLRHKAVRQDSYLAAVKKPLRADECLASKEEKKKKKKERSSDGSRKDSTLKSVDETPPPEIRILESSPVKRPQRPTRLDLTPLAVPSPGQGSDDERITRRVSYLKATWADRVHMDSDLELSDNEPIISPHRRKHMGDRGGPCGPSSEDRSCSYSKTKKMPSLRGRGRFEDYESSFRNLGSHRSGILPGFRTKYSLQKLNVREKWCLLSKDLKRGIGEKATWPYVSWRPRKTPVDHERLDLNNSTVSAAEDYTKRRHVFRLSTPSSSEILLQADTADEMQRWLSALASHENVTQLTNTSGSGQNISPVAAHKGIMKNITTPFRNRSPTGQSPVSKTRKPSQGDVTVVAPKSKTWKVRMAKQLKKIQSGSGSPVSPTAPTSYPEGATIGVPLEHCPKADWCFSDDSLDSLRLNESIDSSGPVQESESAMPNQSLLLGNVHKLEASCMSP
ncbi:unnamed protein product [Nesidiocoris tenuis]|uniref:PH domain-containing protein n=1 Tax=Nesidiocoris tenuis TaxID=355587 RepID=A0A6H5GXN3_9HEMI|nr:unnamed protein product [Nesidiocoris tenuis]